MDGGVGDQQRRDGGVDAAESHAVGRLGLRAVNASRLGRGAVGRLAAVSSGVRGLREPLYALTATFSSKVCAVELALSNTLASESKNEL